MVPKIIHFVWVNPPLPKLADFLVDKWKIMNPDYDIMIHSEPVKKDSVAFSLYKHLRPKVQKSDIVRLDVLAHYGGWYFDTDVVPLFPMHYFQGLLPSNGHITAPWHDPRRLCNDVLCFHKNDDHVALIYDELEEAYKKNTKWKRSHFGPDLISRHYERGYVDTIHHEIVHPWGSHPGAVEAFAAYLLGKEALATHWEMHGKKEPLAFHLWGHRSDRLKELGFG